jgi:hypothetical protein
MDISAILDLLSPQAKSLLGGLLALSFVLSQIISNTKTPDPTTVWGKVYKVLEILAGIYGQAKQTGKRLEK